MMSASDDYCELCDLRLSQCVHGQPPPPPAPPKEKPVRTRSATPRSTTPRTTTARASAPATPPKPVIRRWSPPEAFKPLILEVLTEAGGELEADELFQALEAAAEEHFLVADREAMPGGELRWQFAARKARLQLVEEGLMTKGRPGIWSLA